MKNKISPDSYTIKTDGGRIAKGFLNEKNDCTVRAYSIASGLSYEIAHSLLTKFGRKPKKGIPFINFIKSEFNDCAYIIFKEISNPAKFLKEHPTGKYVCQIKRHVFAVIDGKIYDAFPIPAKKRINYFVEIF